MLLRIKTLFSKKKIKKLLRSSLCLLLCVLTVVFFGGVLAPTQAHAFALVDDAIYFIVAFLICCGLTFSTTSAATSAAQQFYAQAPPSVQEIIDYQAEQLQKDSALPFGVLAVLKSQWKSLIDEFVRQFPQYSHIELDSTNILKEQLNGNSLIAALVGGSVITLANPWKQDTNVFMQTSASTTLSFYGIDTFKKVYGDSTYKAMCSSSAPLNEHFNTQYAIFSSSIGLDLVLVLGWNYLDNATVSLSYYDDADQFRVGSTILEPFGYGCLLYNKELCSVTYSSSGLTITSPTCGNVVQKWIADDVISSNDNLINCDNLTIRSIKALDQLLLGEDVFGVGVDAAHIPGIDSFPSTADDLTDVSSYPDSIGISVPRDLSDTITKTAEDIRTVDKDKTDTDDKTDTKPGESKPNKPSIPGLSLPEILFKEKFPFCLPWDVYNVFANLVAEPEAPVFEIPMKWEFLDIDYTLKIDFSMFDEIAKISRFFSSLGFVVFLILISRKVIGAE